MPPPSSPVPRLSSVPPAVLIVRTIASAHPLTQSHPEADGRPPPSASGRCHRYTSPSTGQQPTEGQRLELSAILPPLACVPLPAAPFCLPCSLFVLISSARSRLTFCPPRPLPGGEGEGRETARAGDPLPLILPTLSTLPGCRPHIPDGSGQRGKGATYQSGGRQSV